MSTETHDIAVQVEKHACRDQWLMVTTLLADLPKYEQEAALQMILDESQRITRTQFDGIKNIIETGEFNILEPK